MILQRVYLDAGCALASLDLQGSVPSRGCHCLVAGGAGEGTARAVALPAGGGAGVLSAARGGDGAAAGDAEGGVVLLAMTCPSRYTVVVVRVPPPLRLPLPPPASPPLPPLPCVLSIVMTLSEIGTEMDGGGGGAAPAAAGLPPPPEVPLLGLAAGGAGEAAGAGAGPRLMTTLKRGVEKAVERDWRYPPSAAR